MDNRVALLTLEEIGMIQRLEDPLEVDTVFKNHTSMKQVLIRLILPMMAELATLFFIIDSFELVKMGDNTYRVDVNHLDTQFKKCVNSFELGEMKSEVEKGGDTPQAPGSI